ncbi:MAG TPA: class I SAM-dependent methyltransferase [Polyangiaceae bacterium]|nr:class I SAM-dependent methyltransferase [Polyangiaceae bacterium]
MQRIPEPELMTDDDQVRAYAEGDFEQPHQRFVDLLRERLPRLAPSGHAVDIGCGPGDIACRLARALPGWGVHGLDASLPMLALARDAATRTALDGRLGFHECYLPDGPAPLRHYDLLVSNSLLHHLADPLALWSSIRRWSHPGSAVFVMDLLRPASTAEASRLVEEYSAGEPDVLRRDFYNSLLAAYRPDEVRDQLTRAGLDELDVEVVSDRHWLVTRR